MNKKHQDYLPSPEEIRQWLLECDPVRLEQLWQRADEVRRSHVGDEVHLRGLIEISNYCVRNCHYCGIRAGNRDLVRYRMNADEILDCAEQARLSGYGTVVLQAGEDNGLKREWIASLVRRIKIEKRLAVTLSLGERTAKDLAAWRQAGADRYLLRFETSNFELFNRIHPAGKKSRQSRLRSLVELRRLGYEVGSGVMVGIPGQTHEDLVADINLFRDFDLDMIGIGPFIPHPATPLGNVMQDKSGVSADELMTYKMVALARLACPQANIPSTTALATVNMSEGRECCLKRGANVFMPNVTPPKYRTLYEIYPAKACIEETAQACHYWIEERIDALGRTIGTGPGGRNRTG